MPEWLIQNIGTIIVCAILILFFGLLIAGLIRDKKAGKSSCGGNCAGCPGACHCHPAPAKTESREGDDDLPSTPEAN